MVIRSGQKWSEGRGWKHGDQLGGSHIRQGVVGRNLDQGE